MKKRHKEVIDAIKDLQGETGYPPSIPELCDKTGIASASVMNYYLEKLEEHGYIQRDRRIARGIYVNPKNWRR